MTEELERIQDCIPIKKTQFDSKIDIEKLLELEGKFYDLNECGKLPISSHIDHYKMSPHEIYFWADKGFCREEAFILILYVGFSSCWINTRLNNRKIKSDPLHKIVVEHLDFILTKLKPANELTVYRKDKHKKIEDSYKWFTENSKSMIQTPWFLSTSIDNFDSSEVI